MFSTEESNFVMHLGTKQDKTCWCWIFEQINNSLHLQLARFHMVAMMSTTNALQYWPNHRRSIRGSKTKTWNKSLANTGSQVVNSVVSQKKSYRFKSFFWKVCKRSDSQLTIEAMSLRNCANLHKFLCVMFILRRYQAPCFKKSKGQYSLPLHKSR